VKVKIIKGLKYCKVHTDKSYSLFSIIARETEVRKLILHYRVKHDQYLKTTESNILNYSIHVYYFDYVEKLLFTVY